MKDTKQEKSLVRAPARANFFPDCAIFPPAQAVFLPKQPFFSISKKNFQLGRHFFAFFPHLLHPVGAIFLLPGAFSFPFGRPPEPNTLFFVRLSALPKLSSARSQIILHCPPKSFFSALPKLSSLHFQIFLQCTSKLFAG